MLELPIVPQEGVENETNSNVSVVFYQKLESAEIKSLIGKDLPLNYHLKYVDEVSGYPYLTKKENKAGIKYIGLVSKNLYDVNGEVLGDVVTEILRTTYGKKKTLQPSESRRVKDFSEFNDPKEIYDQFLSAETQLRVQERRLHLISLNYHRYQLPRNFCVPKVFFESKKTRKIVNKPGVSNAAKKIINRTNYLQNASIELCKHEDNWGFYYLKRRSMHCLINIFYYSMYKHEFDRAFKAISLLLREKPTEVRALWMPALELLSRRFQESRKSPTQLLDWLIVNFPDYWKSKMCVLRPFPLADTFIPVRIMMYIVEGNLREAAEKAEEAVNSADLNKSALCWALRGIVLMRLGKTDSAAESFEKSVKLGGVMSQFITGSGTGMHVDDDGPSELESSDVSSGDDSDFYENISTNHREVQENFMEEVIMEEPEQQNTPESESQQSSDEEHVFYSQSGPIGGELGSDSNESDDDKSENEEKSDEDKSNENKSDEDKSDNDKSDNDKSEDKSNEDKSDNDKSENDKSNDSGGESPQVFYSQASIGAELGSSESEIEV